MKKLLMAIMCTAGLAYVASAADTVSTVYVDGKPISPQVIAQEMVQVNKNPMMQQQLNSPEVKKQFLQSIGMKQAILAEGNAQQLDKTKEYQAKLEDMKPVIYAQIIQDKANAQTITDAQAKAKYEQIKAASQKQVQYDVSHILVKDLKTANDIEVQLKKGANFADLAKKYSQDPGSKDNGGNLGVSDGSSFVPEFTAAIKTLKKGQYTITPVKTQYGYHIIKLNDTKTGVATVLPPFDKVKDQLKQQLQMEKTKKLFDDIAAKHKVQVK